MNTLFGLPRTVFALAAIIVAIVLVVLIGLIIIGSAAIRALMAPGVKAEGISLLALLVTIIVLLSAIFVLLLVLFWCCCRQAKRGKEGQLPPDVVTALLPLLPLLPGIRNVMRDVAVALYASGKTIGWLHQHVSAAGAFLQSVKDTADDDDRKIEVKTFPNWSSAQINPFQPLLENLQHVANSLKAAGYPLTLGTDAMDVSEVATKMQDAGKALAGMAKDLGAPNVPTELAP